MSLIILANVIFGDEDKEEDVLLQVEDIKVDGRFKALRTVWLCKIITGGDVYEVLNKVV